MKLDLPLSNLINRCMTMCVAECCGIDAYDFSPIHIASYLIMYRGEEDPAEVAQIRSQLESLKYNFGSAGKIGQGVSLEEMNQVFLPAEIDAFCEKIELNMKLAIQIIHDFQPPKPQRK